MKYFLVTRPAWNHWLLVEVAYFGNYPHIVWPKGNVWIGVAHDMLFKETELTTPGIKVPKISYRHNASKMKEPRWWTLENRKPKLKIYNKKSG